MSQRGFREPVAAGSPIVGFLLLVLATLIVALSISVSRGDNLDDIRNARQNGLPSVSCWPDGFDLTWQLSKINAGSRLNPVVRLPFPSDGASWAVVVNGAPAGVSLIEPQLAQLGALNLPLTLRCNNLSDSFGTQTQVYLGILPGLRIRGLLQEGPVGTFTLQGTAVTSLNPTIAAHSALIYKQATAGALYDQDRPADAFGPVGNWRFAGAQWANTLWMRRVQDLVPSPTSIDFLDNNEIKLDYYSAYIANGQIKSDADLRKISVRAADYVLAHPGITPAQLQQAISDRQTVLYDAAYQGFRGTVRPEWQSVPFKSLGYSSGPDLGNPQGMSVVPWFDVPNTGNTQTTYLGGNKKTIPSLTNPGMTRICNAIPVWEALEVNDKTVWRDLSISISDGGAINGAQLGLCEVITPERFGGFWEFAYWCLRSPGHSVNLRYWQLNATKPSDLFFSATTAPIAVSLGYADAATATHDSYISAVIAAVDRIHSNPLLRDFYTRGTPVVGTGANPTDSYLRVLKLPMFPPSPVVDNRHRWLNVDVNSPDSAISYSADPVQSWSGQIKCWATATQLGNQTLIFAMTPCKLGMVNVTLPGISVPISIDMTGRVSRYVLVAPDQQVTSYRIQDVTP